MDKNTWPNNVYFFLKEIHFRDKNTNRLKAKWYGKMCINQTKAGVAMLKSGNADFRTKNITADKYEHFIMIKWSIYLWDTTTFMFMQLLTEFQNNMKYNKAWAGLIFNHNNVKLMKLGKSLLLQVPQISSNHPCLCPRIFSQLRT